MLRQSADSSKKLGAVRPGITQVSLPLLGWATKHCAISNSKLVAIYSHFSSNDEGTSKTELEEASARVFETKAK